MSKLVSTNGFHGGATLPWFTCITVSVAAILFGDFGPAPADLLLDRQAVASGCPGFIDNYTLAGNSISVRAGTINLAGSCAKQAEIQNKLVIQAFNKASRIKEEANRLLLQDVQGNTNIVLIQYAQPMHH
jgi:hypothetical protein